MTKEQISKMTHEEAYALYKEKKENARPLLKK